MRVKMKKNIMFMSGLLVVSVFFAVIITILEFNHPKSMWTKYMINMATYVFSSLFIGVIVSLLPEMWKMNEKYDN